MLEIDWQEVKKPSETEGIIFLLYKNGQILVEDVVKRDSGY